MTSPDVGSSGDLSSLTELRSPLDGVGQPLHVLGIPVSPDLAAQWVRWFAPAVQPFPREAVTAGARGLGEQGSPSAELRDTFHLYGPGDERSSVWLSQSGFARLPRPCRVALVADRRSRERMLAPSVASWPTLRDETRVQAGGHRFIWWPSLLSGHEREVLTAYVEDGCQPSRHDEVTPSTWTSAATVLPGARALAGTFPAGSGPNCFGAVMGAAGVPGAQSVWMQREPFEQWLASTTRPGGRDEDVGTVLVWRSRDGLVQHAAVTIGDGWALQKQSQGWMSPTTVLTAADVKSSARQAGHRLQRRSLRVG